MGHDWLFAVLADLRAYATLNGMPAFAAQIDQARRVALAELGLPDPGDDLPPGKPH